MGFMSGKRAATLSTAALNNNYILGTLLATADKKIITTETVEACVTSYLNRATTAILPISEATCKKAFLNYVNSNAIVITIWRASELVGFLIAAKGCSNISDAHFLEQIFYNSTLSGTAAVKAVWAAHRLLVTIARQSGYGYVISHSSHEDSKFSFNKILEKDGWLSIGYLSSFKV